MQITTMRHKVRLRSKNIFLRIAMYSRTQNENGSFNSRCLDCLMTIASCVATEQELNAREEQHTCPEKALAHLLALKRAAVSQAARN